MDRDLRSKARWPALDHFPTVPDCAAQHHAKDHTDNLWGEKKLIVIFSKTAKVDAE